MRVAAVVPCTGGKVGDGPGVALRDVDPGLSTGERAVRWMDRAVAAPPLGAARDVYKGPGWSAGLQLIAALKAATSKVEWRIISAGYGLLRPEDHVARYSATFLAAHEDSVHGTVGGENVAGDWWAAINRLRGQPQPLVKLASEVDGLVFAASASYVDAVAEELVRAADRVPTVVFCAGRPRDRDVAPLAPPFDRRLREGPEPFVQGGDVGFNQRVATRVVELLGTTVVDRPQVEELLTAAMDREQAVRYKRRVASDAEVMAFIAEALASDPSASRTGLLRQWRDAGGACEQRRFGGLYELVVEENMAQLRPEETTCG